MPTQQIRGGINFCLRPLVLYYYVKGSITRTKSETKMQLLRFEPHRIRKRYRYEMLAENHILCNRISRRNKVKNSSLSRNRSIAIIFIWFDFSDFSRLNSTVRRNSEIRLSGRVSAQLHVSLMVYKIHLKDSKTEGW